MVEAPDFPISTKLNCRDETYCGRSALGEMYPEVKNKIVKKTYTPTKEMKAYFGNLYEMIHAISAGINAAKTKFLKRKINARNNIMIHILFHENWWFIIRRIW